MYDSGSKFPTHNVYILSPASCPNLEHQHVFDFFHFQEQALFICQAHEDYFQQGIKQKTHIIENVCDLWIGVIPPKKKNKGGGGEG